jgi:cytochrome P450
MLKFLDPERPNLATTSLSTRTITFDVSARPAGMPDAFPVVARYSARTGREARPAAERMMLEEPSRATSPSLGWEMRRRARCLVPTSLIALPRGTMILLPPTSRGRLGMERS